MRLASTVVPGFVVDVQDRLTPSPLTAFPWRLFRQAVLDNEHPSRSETEETSCLRKRDLFGSRWAIWYSRMALSTATTLTSAKMSA